jgi:hypothetical protein
MALQTADLVESCEQKDSTDEVVLLETGDKQFRSPARLGLDGCGY